MKRKTLAIALLSLAPLGFGACATMGSSTLSCPVRHGVTCMSASDVYSATNSADEVVGLTDKEAKQLGVRGDQPYAVRKGGELVVPDQDPVRVPPAAPAAMPQQPALAPPRCCSPAEAALQADASGATLLIANPGTPTVASLAGTPAMNANGQPQARVGDTEPYRVPAQIMRIYVRPWEDAAGDLHMAGYVFSEVQPRKWSLADRTEVSNHLVDVLGAPIRIAAQEATPSAGNTSTGSHDRSENPGVTTARSTKQ